MNDRHIYQRCPYCKQYVETVSRTFERHEAPEGGECKGSGKPVR